MFTCTSGGFSMRLQPLNSICFFVFLINTTKIIAFILLAKYLMLNFCFKYVKLFCLCFCLLSLLY